MKLALDDFLIRTLGFIRSRVEGCLYIYKKGNDWVKLINYMNYTLYTSSSDQVRVDYKNKLKKRFNLSSLGVA